MHDDLQQIVLKTNYLVYGSQYELCQVDSLSAEASARREADAERLNHQPHLSEEALVDALAKARSS